jgi:hypothetical protein
MLAGALVLASALVAAAGLSTGSAGAASQAAPKNTTEPRISGSAVVGSTLTATRGDWSGTAPLSYAFQWVRCPSSGGKSDGSDCAAIAGATTSAYVVGSGDEGRRLRVRVTASNADGSATAASNPTALVTSGTTTGRPRNTRSPSISGTPAFGATLHADPGVWTGRQPITFTFQWLRCDTRGNNCVQLPGQVDDSYAARDGDIGRTLRVRVTARNADGQRSALSSQTAVVQGQSLPDGAVKLPSGETSIPVTSVPASERLVVDRVDFSPTPVRSRSTPITIPIKVKDTRGYVVRDALVFLRSTPVVTSTPADQRTGQDGTLTYTVQPETDFPIRNDYSVQFFVKAFRQGDNPLGGVAGYRLVQVATAR